MCHQYWRTRVTNHGTLLHLTYFNFLMLASTYNNMSLVPSYIECQRFIAAERCKNPKYAVLLIYKAKYFSRYAMFRY